MIPIEAGTGSAGPDLANSSNLFTSRPVFLMRELDQPPEGHIFGAIERVAIVGPGRLGTAIAASLTRAGVAVDGPYGRRDPVTELLRAPARRPDAGGRESADAVLLCVPDAEIAAIASVITIAAPIGHCSGATALDVLAPHECFSLHPLMTVPADAPPDVLAGAGAAVAGSTPRALALALALAQLLAMQPIEIAEADRAAYHAAACIASNFLVTLEAAAERVAATAGLSPELLVPLVRTTVENWATLGPQRALTGPVARGDEATIERQRAAVADRTPELLELFDTCVDATRQLAASPTPKPVAA
jgi:predicted short-subunit dehydrogenase-like oxidoreductase (DUF2520 family)